MTTYNIHMMVEHPTTIVDGAPEGRDILLKVEELMLSLGTQPVAGQIERNESETVDGIGTAPVKSMPPVILLAVAKFFDEQMEAKANPELDTWDPKFVGYDLPFDMVDLAAAILLERAK